MTATLEIRTAAAEPLRTIALAREPEVERAPPRPAPLVLAVRGRRTRPVRLGCWGWHRVECVSA